MGNTVMRPQCDTYCDYWTLKDSCVLSKVTYLFDNYSTVIFSIFMSVWGESCIFDQYELRGKLSSLLATTYLELWKRRQAILQWEWDLKSEEDMDDTIRPEFEQNVKTTR